jgi:hypothetical protein
MGADHFRLHVSDRFGDLFPGKSPMCRDEHWVLRDSDDSGMVQSVHPSPKKTVLSLQKPPPQFFLDHKSQNHGAKDICASLMTNKKQRGMSI